MLFNSYVFIFAFLPCCLLGYYSLNNKDDHLGKLFLIVMSLVFYAYNRPSYLPIIISSVLINYAASRVLTKCQRNRKLVLALAITFNVGLIVYYKYLDFFIWNLNTAFRAHIPYLNVILPLGISFFTFQQISYVVDSYHGQTEGYGFIEYALYVVFFPQLVAGPIVLHSEIIPQLRDSEKWKFNTDSCIQGIFLFVRGLFKKMILADALGVCVDWGYGNISELTALDAVFIMISFCIQLYLDFSGYSDMAIGLGRMFNISLPNNFNSPLKSLGIIEFWKRWHITLNRFLTTYVYYPLGGNRKGKLRTYLNILIVFMISGLWHGANYTFWLWGLLHGILNVIERIGNRYINRIPKAIRWFGTFIAVSALFSLFRASGIKQYILLLKRLTHGNWWSCSPALMELYRTPFLSMLYKGLRIYSIVVQVSWLSALLPLACILLFLLILNCNSLKEFSINMGSIAFTALLLVWCICSLNHVSSFLYFNF